MTKLAHQGQQGLVSHYSLEGSSFLVSYVNRSPKGQYLLAGFYHPQNVCTLILFSSPHHSNLTNVHTHNGWKETFIRIPFSIAKHSKLDKRSRISLKNHCFGFGQKNWPRKSHWSFRCSRAPEGNRNDNTPWHKTLQKQKRSDLTLLSLQTSLLTVSQNSLQISDPRLPMASPPLRSSPSQRHAGITSASISYPALSPHCLQLFEIMPTDLRNLQGSQ
jgi:hypothetical protein